MNPCFQSVKSLSMPDWRIFSRLFFVPFHAAFCLGRLHFIVSFNRLLILLFGLAALFFPLPFNFALVYLEFLAEDIAGNEAENKQKPKYDKNFCPFHTVKPLNAFVMHFVRLCVLLFCSTSCKNNVLLKTF